MRKMQVDQRHNHLMVAALLYRLQFWRGTLARAKQRREPALEQKAGAYITEYAELLSELVDSGCGMRLASRASRRARHKRG
jgi:hypothetical protein